MTNHKLLNFIILPILASIFLSACSTHTSTFDCSHGIGEKCKSISEVNRLVDGGRLSTQNKKEKGQEQIRVWEAPVNGNPEGDFFYISIP